MINYVMILSSVWFSVHITSDGFLRKHFAAHHQSQWSAIRSLTAQGEWHEGPKDWQVNFYMKRENKLAVSDIKNKAKLVLNKDQAIISAVGMEGPEILSAMDVKALQQAWTFGSPLEGKEEQLTKKQSVKIDEQMCEWYQLVENEFTFDYFIKKKDHLIYQTNITVTNDPSQQAITTVLQYRKLGPMQLPFQVKTHTSNKDYLFVFTDYVLGDVVNEKVFQP